MTLLNLPSIRPGRSGHQRHKLIDEAAFGMTQFGTYLAELMNRHEFSLHYHELQFKNQLFMRTGKAFQDFFEQIMQKYDSSFLMIKPMGKVGDWKADGYSTKTGTVFQCYAPENLTGQKTSDKVEEDFEGAKAKWKDKMRGWVFVWNANHGLPPQVVGLLVELKRQNAHLIIDQLGPPGLWDIVKTLSLADRESILGAVPRVDFVPDTTAAEIQVLMTHLGQQTLTPLDSANLDLTAIAEKLQRNKLSNSVKAIVTPAMPIAKLVGSFVGRMPDPEFSQRIAIDLADKYLEFQGQTSDPDTIFGSLVEYALGARKREPKFFWAAAGIISYYFELCDIFER